MFPRLHSWFASVSCAVALLLASPAHAGCPHLCNATAKPPVITPPLSCGTLRATAATCDCSLELFLVNNCAQDSIVAVDFEFDGCSKAASPTDPCTEVSPQGNAGVIYPLSTVGETRKTLTLRDAAGDHTVEVSATVSSFRDSGCSISSAAHEKPLAALSILAFTAVTLGRRRRARNSG